MKKYINMTLVLIMMFVFTACGNRELADMMTEVNDEYASIVWEDKTYVPYCAVSKKDCGEQIGIVDGDKDNRIYEYKDYSLDEWIVNSYISGLMDGYMLYKEINVSNIPDGLESEYEWNNEMTVTFQATVIEVNNDTILVKPVDGSSELNSADQFSVSNEKNLGLQAGDLIEIDYNGEIMESYPAQLGEVYKITVMEREEKEHQSAEPDKNASGKTEQTQQAIAESTSGTIIRVGEEKIYDLTEEEAKIIADIIEKGAWSTEGTADCANDCKLIIDERTYYYHSECGTFNDKVNNQNLSVTAEEKESINVILAHYITLGPE